jgi:hypothetical protein
MKNECVMTSLLTDAELARGGDCIDNTDKVSSILHTKRKIQHHFFLAKE